MLLLNNSGKFYKVLFSFSIIFWYQQCLEYKSGLINFSNVPISDSGGICESIDLIFVKLFPVQSSFKGFEVIRLDLDFFISDDICGFFQLKIENVNADEFFIIVVILQNSLKIFGLTDNFEVSIEGIEDLEHIVNVRKTFDFDLIVEFVEILLKLSVFGDFLVYPEIWDLFDEVLLKLFRFS